MSNVVTLALVAILALGLILLSGIVLDTGIKHQQIESSERIAAYHESQDTERTSIVANAAIEISNIEADAKRDTSVVYVVDRCATTAAVVGLIFVVVGYIISRRR